MMCKRFLCIVMCLLSMSFVAQREAQASGMGSGGDIILLTLAPFTTTAELGTTIYHSVGWAVSTTSSPAMGVANVQQQYLKNNKVALSEAFVFGGGAILNDLAVVYRLPIDKHALFIRSIKKHRKALLSMSTQREVETTHRFLSQLAQQLHAAS